eukprot:scaffold112664_cov18-Tisochrysis_lutea.AAC.2
MAGRAEELHVAPIAAPKKYLVSSSDAIQLVTRPDANNGAHSKVAVNDGRTVQGIKGHTEARSTDIHWLRHLLGAGQLHDVLHGRTTMGMARAWMSAGRKGKACGCSMNPIKGLTIMDPLSSLKPLFQ